MRVLVVEDDAVSRKLLTRYLEQWGHEVTAAEDGEEGWELFQGEQFPIVVSDWIMPRSDGVELVRRIRAGRWPGYVYVVLLTSKTDKADVAEGIEAGADEFVRKPNDREELQVKLWEAERVVRLQEDLKEQ